MNKTRRKSCKTAKDTHGRPALGLTQALFELADAHKDADVLASINEYSRQAQEVEEYYEGKLFVGKPERAMKMFREYMAIQAGIFECTTEDVHELMNREQVRNDIVLLTRMQTENPRARLVTSAMTNGGQGGENAKSGEDNRETNAALQLLLRSLSSSMAKAKGTPTEGVDEETSSDRTIQNQRRARDSTSDRVMDTFAEKAARPKADRQTQTEGSASREKKPLADIKTKKAPG